MNQYIKSSISNIAGLVRIKDLDNRYRYVNEHWLRLATYDVVDDVIGLTDDDIVAHALNIPKGYSLNDYKQSFIDSDEQAYRGDSLYILDVHYYYQDKVHFFLGHKSPYYEAGDKISGVLGQAIELVEPSWASIQGLLQNPQIQISKFSRINIELFFSVKLSKFELSCNERMCVQYIAQGMTAKQVAAIQHRSVRTVEAHLDNAKQKLGCRNRVELVTQSLMLGLI